MANLFQSGLFKLHGGKLSTWKIECDALTPDDWITLARMAAEILPYFGAVHGVPSGGLPFAAALDHFRWVGSPNILIAEDVVTTGDSMEAFRTTLPAEQQPHIIGVCVFARGKCPSWVRPLFQMPV